MYMIEKESGTSDRIRELNDRFRTTMLPSLGRVVATQGVMALGDATLHHLVARTRQYQAFNEDNDPYGEHDFGKMVLDGKAFFWEIDYYDTEYEYGSEDPADEQQTRRVLTIMCASEY